MIKYSLDLVWQRKKQTHSTKKKLSTKTIASHSFLLLRLLLFICFVHTIIKKKLYFIYCLSSDYLASTSIFTQWSFMWLVAFCRLINSLFFGFPKRNQLRQKKTCKIETMKPNRIGWVTFLIVFNVTRWLLVCKRHPSISPIQNSF